MKNSVNLNQQQPGIKVNPLFDANQVLKGVIIPIGEREKLLKPSVAKELYNYMSKLSYKPIYESSFEELQQRAAPVIEKVHQELLDKGLYLSYRNELCVTSDLMIHEYQQRIELVSVDVKSGTYIVKQVYQK